MKSLLLFIIAACMCSAMLAGEVLAQHPIEIERLHADGEYVRAMASFERLPTRRRTTAAIIAAAQSAWALGLNTEAAELFARALQSEDLDSEHRARLLLSRSVIEFQLGKPERAILFAQKSAALLSQPSPLRAQVHAVWGKALLALDESGRACMHLAQAVEEATEQALGGLHYELGLCFEKVGRFDDARDMLERIPLEDERAPAAIRRLILLAIDQGHAERADFWLRKGKELFPERFIDSWVAYAEAVVATKLGRFNQSRKLLEDAALRFPPSDPWFQLLRAVVEQALFVSRDRAQEVYQSGESAQSVSERSSAMSPSITEVL